MDLITDHLALPYLSYEAHSFQNAKLLGRGRNGNPQNTRYVGNADFRV